MDIPVRRVDIALRNAAAFPKFFVDSPAGWLQSLRTHRHNSILYRQRESLRALLAKPEVFNLAEARIAVRRRRCPSLDVEYAALAQVSKGCMTCRIRALGEHGDTSFAARSPTANFNIIERPARVGTTEMLPCPDLGTNEIHKMFSCG